jgi:Rrf2 family protein
VKCGFNSSYSEYPGELSVHELFTRQAGTTPDKAAIIFENQKFTFRQIDEMSNALARFLRKKEIAENEGISQKYLESIMTVLSKGDLVDALHGKGGGYRLNKPAENYTVGSILKLTEGSLNVASCTAQGASACSRSTCCNTLPMWERLDKLIDDFFEGITLADLLKESQTLR